ncbi:hypothetical protein LWI28_015400 [Acer negundo]|uniref:Uncharacterized protein n=1 Tax=Acer negundo TaxID=4023 RepID=A0AAD5P0K8_ACENE|nr:hypothetical protein LWI28_015400 [Acer negundo]
MDSNSNNNNSDNDQQQQGVMGTADHSSLAHKEQYTVAPRIASPYAVNTVGVSLGRLPSEIHVPILYFLVKPLSMSRILQDPFETSVEKRQHKGKGLLNKGKPREYKEPAHSQIESSDSRKERKMS